MAQKGDFMERDYGMEIDVLKKELEEVKGLLRGLVQRNVAALGQPAVQEENCCKKEEDAGGQLPGGNEINRGIHSPGSAPSCPPAPPCPGSAPSCPSPAFLEGIEIIRGMHPDPQISEQMEELCRLTAEGEKGQKGLINYMGIFASGGRQQNWIRHQVSIADLLALIENHTAEKVLSCIGNGDRLNLLLAILKKTQTVAELVAECGFNSTGQAYHHMKPLLAADLIVETGKGIYVAQQHKVQGIIMLLAGIADMVDETYTKGCWEA